jgi:CheY-like chemotaxis protein
VDVLMPDIDGIQLTERIRRSPLNRQVPIIMLTGQDDADTMRRGFNAGVSFFLGKPFTRERITALFAAARGPMLKEKRLHARLPYRAAVECRWYGQRQGHFKAGSIDICEDGMLMGPSGGLDVGQEIDLEFEMPTAKAPLKPRAKILRKDKADHIAVAFREAIRNFINARVTT